MSMLNINTNIKEPELHESFGIYLSALLIRFHAPNSLSASTIPTGQGQRILLPTCIEMAMKGSLRQLKESGYRPSQHGNWGRLNEQKSQMLKDTGYVESHKLHSVLYALMKDICPSAVDELEESYQKLYRGHKSLSHFLRDVDNEVIDSRYGWIDWKSSRKQSEKGRGQYGRQIRTYDKRFFRRYDAAIIAVYQQANYLGLGQILDGITLRNVVAILTIASRKIATKKKEQTILGILLETIGFAQAEIDSK